MIKLYRQEWINRKLILCNSWSTVYFNIRLSWTMPGPAHEVVDYTCRIPEIVGAYKQKTLHFQRLHSQLLRPRAFAKLAELMPGHFSTDVYVALSIFKDCNGDVDFFILDLSVQLLIYFVYVVCMCFVCTLMWRKILSCDYFMLIVIMVIKFNDINDQDQLKCDNDYL